VGKKRVTRTIYKIHRKRKKRWETTRAQEKKKEKRGPAHLSTKEKKGKEVVHRDNSAQNPTILAL